MPKNRICTHSTHGHGRLCERWSSMSTKQRVCTSYVAHRVRSIPGIQHAVWAGWTHTRPAGHDIAKSASNHEEP